METSEDMPVTTEKNTREGVAAGIRGERLTEAQMKSVLKVVAKRMADRKAREIFISHAHTPLSRVMRYVNSMAVGKVSWRGK
jgi:hypothetical protein